MKKFLTISIGIILGICFFGCEKDDICASTTPTTPRLVLEFYDFANPAEKKSIVNLTALGEGASDELIFNETRTDSTKYYANAVTTISLPLDIAKDSTSYKLKMFANNTSPAVFNDDNLTIRYTREQVYVSRACGYKTIFYLENVIRDPSGENNTEWIRNLTFDPIIIDNEQDIHVKIYW